MSGSQWFQQNKAILFQLFVVFGMISSYIPQQVILYRVKDSSGLNPIFLLFAVCGCLFQLTNIVGSHWNKIFVDLDIEIMLKVLVIVSQTAMIIVICILYFAFFPVNKRKTRQFLTSKYCLIASAFIFLISFLLTVGFRYFSEDPTFIIYSDINGYLNSICTCFQYIPQVLHTFFVKNVVSISILTLLIQIPGSLVLIFSMAISGGKVSNWISYAIGGSFQIILLVLCLYYNYSTKSESKEESTDDSEKEHI